MNLNEAFRLRNRLKDRIRDLKDRVAKAEHEKNEGTDEFTRPLDGKTLKETIELTDSLMDLLCAFNEAIENANTVNRIDLVRMEALKQKIAFYSGIIHKSRQGKGYEYEYSKGHYSGDSMIKIVKVLVLDQASMVEKYNALNTERDALETHLAKQNAKIQVEFDSTKIKKALE